MDIDKERLALKIVNNKQSSFEWQQRRHEDWTDNYTLYRDKVIVNRLTQRQSVNMPLMKYSIRTSLKDIDDPPELSFENLDNDKDKEIFYNEYWKLCSDKKKLVIKDIVDKKNVLLYGRSFKKLFVKDSWPHTEIRDPFDILVDRYADPADPDATAQFFIHQHIYRPMGVLETNPNYDATAIVKLKEFYATKMGLVKSAENVQSMADRNKRMEVMGVPDIENPIVGETYVELNENYIRLWNPDKKKYEIYLVTTSDPSVNPEEAAQNLAILMVKPLDEVFGKTKDGYWLDHYPLISWGDDIEGTDFWSDGMADIIRTPNKILNAWFSQLVENRTLRNFGMNYFDSSLQGFFPDTFEPVPWGWYPVPGDPNTSIKRVDIPELSESLDEMQFIVSFMERATAVTATQQGVPTQKQITLGEIQLTLAEAKERVQSIAKFYNESWKEYGEKFIKLIEAAPDKLTSVKVYKRKSPNTRIFEKEIKPADWKTQKGYRVKVEITSEKNKRDMESLQKLNAVKAAMPNNQPLDKIYKKKMLGLVDMTEDETKEVMDFEYQNQGMGTLSPMTQTTARVNQTATSIQ